MLLNRGAIDVGQGFKRSELNRRLIWINSHCSVLWLHWQRLRIQVKADPYGAYAHNPLGKAVRPQKELALGYTVSDQGKKGGRTQYGVSVAA